MELAGFAPVGRCEATVGGLDVFETAVGI